MTGQRVGMVERLPSAVYGVPVAIIGGLMVGRCLARWHGRMFALSGLWCSCCHHWGADGWSMFSALAWSNVCPQRFVVFLLPSLGTDGWSMGQRVGMVECLPSAVRGVPVAIVGG